MHRPNTLLLDNALATMGAGVPSAIAALLVHPERAVLAVVGDGGFMMNSAELATAVRLQVGDCARARDARCTAQSWQRTWYDHADFLATMRLHMWNVRGRPMSVCYPCALPCFIVGYHMLRHVSQPC